MAGTALIVIDMLNPYDHEDAEKLVDSVASNCRRWSSCAIAPRGPTTP